MCTLISVVKCINQHTIDVSFIAYCVTEFEALFLAMFERQFLKFPPNISLVFYNISSL